MTSKWTEVTLGDLVYVKHGYAFKGKFFSQEGDKLVLKPGNFPVGGGLRLRPGKDAFYTGEFPAEFELSPGDLLLVMTDLTQSAPILGSPAFVPSEPVMLHNQRLGLVKIKRGMEVDRRFLYYAMLSEACRSQIRATATGATVRHTAPERIYKVSIGLPPLSVQRVIGEALGSIDDLIENNRRRVEVLEEMARAIYREWFVKFRYPGHGDVPLVDSALGSIPEGWEVRTIRDLSAVVVRGISPKYVEDGEWIVLNQKCIRNGRVSLAPSRRQERSVSDAKRVRSGDVLINSTGVGTLGRVAMYRGSSEGVTVDSHVTICRPLQESLNPWYAMSMLAKQSEIERLGAGATGQTELRKSDVEALDLVRPMAPVVDAFHVVISPLLGQIDLLLANIETMAALRDRLLPKLVTGRIDVSTLDLDALISTGSTGEGALA